MKAFLELSPRHTEFIRRQHMFFVATAPLASEGHVNLSPKGYASFAVLGPRRVAYIDLGGSGIETHAHLQENGRICLMFCSFEDTPLIVRLYGSGRSHAYGSPEFAALRPHFPAIEVPVRNIVEVALQRVQDSCGWGVPFFEYRGERPTLRDKNGASTQEELIERRYQKNAESIDGLPGLRRRP
jgi:hypothetical protein